MNGKTYNNEQDQWDKMTKACLEASAEILGYEEKKERQKLQQILKLKHYQTNRKTLESRSIQQNSIFTERVFGEKNHRNKQMKKIEKKLQEIQEQKITEYKRDRTM